MLKMSLDVFFIAVIAILLCILMRQCDKIKQSDFALNAIKEDVKFWKDESGHAHASITVMKADRETVIKLKDGIIDSLKKENIKLRNVKSFTTITKHTIDTIDLSRASYSTRWLKYQYIDSTRLIVNSIDSLALITHFKKYGFLNLRSKYIAEAISYNQNTIIKGITSVEIDPAPRRISVGFYSGYGLSLSAGQLRPGFNLGVGIMYRIR